MMKMNVNDHGKTSSSNSKNHLTHESEGEGGDVVIPHTTPSPSSSSSSSALFSKMSLYTSLACYNNEKGLSPAEYAHTTTTSTTPKSIRESSLIQLWHAISVDYHTNTNVHTSSCSSSSKRAVSGFVKNTSSRPVSLQNMDESLRHRAINLKGGGGYYYLRSNHNSHRSRSRTSQDHRNAIKKRLLIPNNQSTTAISRRRKRRKRNTVKMSTTASVFQTQMQFIMQLNALWNAYARTTLGTTAADVLHALTAHDPPPPSRRPPPPPGNHHEKKEGGGGEGCGYDDDYHSIHNRILDWTGARVRVVHCPAQRDAQGREGYLLGESAHTWRILFCDAVAVAVQPPQQIQQENAHANDNNDDNHNNDHDAIIDHTTRSTDSRTDHMTIDHESTKANNNQVPSPSPPPPPTLQPHPLRIRVIPKRATSLAVLIPISEEANTTIASTKSTSANTSCPSKMSTSSGSGDGIIRILLRRET